MRRLTLPLLTASYAILAMILALLLWRNGVAGCGSCGHWSAAWGSVSPFTD